MSDRPRSGHDRVVKGRRTSVAAGALFGLVLVEVATAVAAGTASGLGVGSLVAGFAVSNAVIGLSLGVAGWPLAWHRPSNPIGWLLLAAGLCYGSSAAGYAVLAAATEPGADALAWRLVGTATNLGWTWAISLLVPVALLIFPDGRLPSRRWRWLLAVAVVNGVVFAAMGVVPPETLSAQLGVVGYLTVTSAAQLGWVAALNAVLSLTLYGGALVALVMRYRRGDDRVRRQLLWLVLAAMLVLGGAAVSAVFNIDSWLSVFSITLIPLGVMIAILRYQLLDIRLVVSRSWLYLVLTALVVGVYMVLVSVLDATLRRQIGLGSSVIATLVIAAVFHPVRQVLQTRIDRIFYGARRDPVRAVAEVGARLGEVGVGSAGLDGVLAALCQVMRLPAASLSAGGRQIAAFGTLPALRQAMSLSQGNDAVGELVVGLRAGESRLDPADERVLGLLSTSLAVAMGATALAADLGKAREALVTAREEERRRLRRDLHDGLGPALTGVALKAEAARRLVATDAALAATLMAELRTQTTAAINDIRRLVHDLRPPTLDGLGLVAALREQAVALARRADGAPIQVDVDADDPLPQLSAAAEVAAYRIATEALTNVSRHSAASLATVTLRADPTALILTIRDNGTSAADWAAGVGLTSIRERAQELGGACQVGPGPDGGQVLVTIPLGGAR